MLDNDFFDTVANKLSSSLPPGVKNLQDDIEGNIKSILTSAFRKLDLVTREEFDVQTRVLAKTRIKLEKLEDQVDSLLEKLDIKEI
jgi:ubiquinone biosynthesis accessory factor UbiK